MPERWKRGGKSRSLNSPSLHSLSSFSSSLLRVSQERGGVGVRRRPLRRRSLEPLFFFSSMITTSYKSMTLIGCRHVWNPSTPSFLISFLILDSFSNDADKTLPLNGLCRTPQLQGAARQPERRLDQPRAGEIRTTIGTVKIDKAPLTFIITKGWIIIFIISHGILVRNF